jgi:diaminohydroxyphosphoribosylaminopyrimidine deaminase/5-amino-6-(5-phosphoribosylamino)uracil reductase
MQQALLLARQGQGFVEPNPMVGCLIVKNRHVVGRGRHRRFGGPHAERNALRAAGRAASSATVYVTLEPCGHTAKTPPCCEALIRARVKRVVVALQDPNPLVAGKGLEKLRKAGIQVDVGLLRAQAAALNAPFITYHRLGRPYVILKWAQSIDGKIATRRGDSKWITGPQSRLAAHALRARVDAVVVGVDTVIADDPELTARLARPKRLATRIVLDPNLRIPLRARLVRTARQTPTIIVTSKHAAGRLGRQTLARGAPAARADKLRRLERAGCKVLQLPGGRSGIRLTALLRRLHSGQMTNILVEGGGRTLGAFMSNNLADEAQIFVAPRLIGGETAPGPLRHLGPATLRDAPTVTVSSVAHLGADLCYNIKLG